MDTIDRDGSHTCQLCGRGLRNRESILRGYGPICYGKKLASIDRDPHNHNASHKVNGDFVGDVIVTRANDGALVTNIPQSITRHSPTGFEIGYGGSGPADFALNILVNFCDQYTSERFYQDFKWKFIADMDKAGGVITAAEVIPWLKSRGCQLGSDGKFAVEDPNVKAFTSLKAFNQALGDFCPKPSF